MPDPASDDPRILYAADRTVLAAERTYAAWVRTGLFSLAAGVGAKTTLGPVLPEWTILFNATLLVLFSAFCFAAAVWRNLRPGHELAAAIRRAAHPARAAGGGEWRADAGGAGGAAGDLVRTDAWRGMSA